MKTLVFLSLILVVTSFVSGSFGYGDLGDTLTINTYIGNITNLSEMQDVNIPAPTDNQLLQYDSGTSMWTASSVAGFTDTNASTACSGAEYLAGNGSCLEISVTGDDWNKTYADTLYYGIDNPSGFYNSTDFSIGDYYLGSNPSNYWNDTFATFNKTYADTLYADISVASDNESWNETYANTLYSNDTWVDTYFIRFTEIVSLVGNWTADKVNYYTSTTIDSLGNWSADKADYSTTTEAGNLYAPINYGDDWNETYADTLYQTTGSYLTAESDPYWTANQSSYSTKTVADGLYADIAVTTTTTLPAENITAGTFGTGNYVFDTNVTVEKLVFENDNNHKIEDNSTCIKIYGDTSILEIC